jgi:hypothetical protein
MLISLLLIINSECTLAKRSDVSIKEEPTYQLVNTLTKNNKIIGKYYEIYVSLYNSGDVKSERLTVNLSDQEGFVLEQDTYVEPGETKIVTFNWSTTYLSNQNMKVNFFPADVYVPTNQYNSGSTSFEIEIVNNNGVPATSTPGFEIIFLISAILIIYFLSKKNKK